MTPFPLSGYKKHQIWEANVFEIVFVFKNTCQCLRAHGMYSAGNSRAKAFGKHSQLSFLLEPSGTWNSNNRNLNFFFFFHFQMEESDGNEQFSDKIKVSLPICESLHKDTFHNHTATKTKLIATDKRRNCKSYPQSINAVHTVAPGCPNVYVRTPTEAKINVK